MERIKRFLFQADRRASAAAAAKKAAALLWEIKSCRQKGLSQAAAELKEAAIDMAFELEDLMSGALLKREKAP